MKWLRPPVSLFLTLALVGTLLAACSSGIDNIESYKQATKGFPAALKSVDRATKVAEMAGDPMRVRDAFDKVIPAVKGLQTALGEQEISNPEIAAIHGELQAAVTEFIDTIVGMEPTIMQTKLTVSKPMIIDSRKAMHDATDVWTEAVEGFGQ